MSNIIFKGDTIKDFGEFYPNIYIDRVVVRNNGSENVFLDISYSLFFHITDEFDKEDIADILQNINFYFAVSNQQDKNNQLLTKQQLISDIKKPTLLSDPIGSSARTSFYPFSKEGITENLNNNAYTDDVYDSQDRRVMIINSEETISYSTFERDESHVYLYAFTSLYDLSGIQQLNMDVLNTQAIYDLSIGDVSYEKVFSPNFNILRQAQIIYLDVTGAKYSDTPLLSLNALYYKNEAAKRQLMVDKVQNLVKRFTPKNNLGPLAEMAASINYVISQFGASENLLVELDRVRKSFPNKTNNNPIGNLYASFSKLLININSSFSAGDVLSKEKIVTGKVIDRREEPRTNELSFSFSNEQEYIPTDGFLIERNRISNDASQDLSSNGGFFFLRYEAFLKTGSKLSQIVNIDRLLSFPLPSEQENLRSLIFSMLKLKRIGMAKYELGTNELLSFNHIQFDTQTREKNRFGNAVAPKGVETSEIFSVEQNLKEHLSLFQGPTPEVVLTYEFLDLDSYPAVYEILQNEDHGGMAFKYIIEVEFFDGTMTMASLIDRLVIQAINMVEEYEQLASEICSYNNIQNRFNDFFVQKINELYSEGEPTPWERAVYMYSLVKFVLTDEFQTSDKAQSYCKNLINTISPSTGTLQSIKELIFEMQQFNDELLSTGTPYYNKKQELMSTSNDIVINAEIDVNLKTQNTAVLSSEAELEAQSVLNLFDYYGNIQYSQPRINTSGGAYITGSPDSDSVTAISFTVWTEGEYYSKYIIPNVLKIFDDVSFGLNYIKRVVGTQYTTFTDYGYVGMFSYNLNNVENAGHVSGTVDNSFYETGYWKENWQNALVSVIRETFSKWFGNLLQKAKKRRDAHLLQSSRLGIPFDYISELDNPRELVDSFISTLENQLKDAFLEAFKEALAADDERGEFTDSEIRLMLRVFALSDDGRDNIQNLVSNIYLYYRDNMRYLLDDINILSIKYGGGTAPEVTRLSLDDAADYYSSIQDPVTELPDFIKDYNPYIKYTGPKLEDIPALEYFDFESYSELGD